MSNSPRSTTPPESLAKLTSVKFTGETVETTVLEKKKIPEMEQKSSIFKDLKGLKGRLSEKWHEKLPELQDRLPDSISTFITEKLESSDKKESILKKSVSVDTVPSTSNSPGKHSRHSSAEVAKITPDFEMIEPGYTNVPDEEGEEITEEFEDAPPHMPKTSSKSYPVNLNELLEQPTDETSSKSTPSCFPQRWRPSFNKGHIFLALLILLVAICMPVSSFISGLIIGACLSALVVPFFIYTFNPWNFSPPPLPDVKDLPPMASSRGLTERSSKFEGWMNIFSNGDYNPETFHLIDTKSAYVQLDICILTVKIALKSLPRRACYKHKLPLPAQTQFLDETIVVDLRDCNVLLLPEKLVHKRLWSKKYPICIKPSDGSRNIVLFARTCLQKEQWYHRMNSASLNIPIPAKLPDISKRTLEKRLSTSALETLIKDQSFPSVNNPEASLESLILHLSQILPPESLSSTRSKVRIEKIGRVLCEPSMIWINTIISRVLWDVLKQPLWAARIMEKIQKKLAKINKPFFVDDLMIVGIDLGKAVPILRRSAVPYVDSDGLWIDIDMAYSGGVALSIETNLNLLKLRKNDSVTSSPTTDKKNPVTDSDEEDSAESSTDDEAPNNTSEIERSSNAGVSARLQKSVNKKKIMQLVDRITNSRYFHAAAENRYVQRAMKEVSNTPLQLTVDIKSCVGTLVLHIPHPPTDRLWWGFKYPPQMWLTATPKIGERQVSVTHVTDWIEKKLVKEFERIVVLPNMDDIPLEPVLTDEGFLEKM